MNGSNSNEFSRPVRVGIGGPVGSGKTMLTLRLCEVLREKYSMVVITNDIYTKEDAQYLARNGALSEDRIMGVETGGCPHTAIRDDTSMNSVAIEHSKPVIQMPSLFFWKVGVIIYQLLFRNWWMLYLCNRCC